MKHRHNFTTDMSYTHKWGFVTYMKYCKVCNFVKDHKLRKFETEQVLQETLWS